MSDQTKAIDFEAIVQQMIEAEKHKVTEGEIAVIGGVFDLSASKESIFADETLAPESEQSASDKLRKFIEAWQPDNSGMKRVIWETVDRIDMDYTNKILTAETAYNELMRARFFGEKGDLSLRRDGDRLYWHFIGSPPDDDFPKIKNACRFWEKQESLPESERVKELRLQENVEALLWGERIVPKSGEAFWREDRVGAIDLVYPVPISDANVQKQRAKVSYDVYWHNGQPAFVWFKKLVDASSQPETDEEKNNG